MQEIAPPSKNQSKFPSVLTLRRLHKAGRNQCIPEAPSPPPNSTMLWN
jgi:hypothetical protein